MSWWDKKSQKHDPKAKKPFWKRMQDQEVKPPPSEIAQPPMPSWDSLERDVRRLEAEHDKYLKNRMDELSRLVNSIHPRMDLDLGYPSSPSTTTHTMANQKPFSSKDFDQYMLAKLAQAAYANTPQSYVNKSGKAVSTTSGGSKPKVGEKYSVKDKSRIFGMNANEVAYIIINRVDGDGELWFEVYNSKHENMGGGSGYLADELMPYKAPKIPEKKKVTMDSVVMSDDKKEQIMAAISQMQHNDLIFTDWGFADVIEKGKAVSLLFYGPPGTGKTLTAQAIADSLDLNLKIIQSGEIQSSEPGAAERNIKAFFENATKQKQLLLLDECDSLISDRNEVGMILGAQINALLTAIENYEGVVVFTTNRLGKMDPAFERRVSAKIEFEFPDQEQRAHIWQRLMPKKAPIAKDVDFRVLSRIPIAGGHIKNCVLSAARHAAYKQKKEIDAECFEFAIRKEWESIKGFKKAFKEQAKVPRLGGGIAAREGGGYEIKNSDKMEIEQEIKDEETSESSSSSSNEAVS